MMIYGGMCLYEFIGDEGKRVSGQTHKLSAPFQSGDNYLNLNLLKKLTEKTKEIEKFVNC